MPNFEARMKATLKEVDPLKVFDIKYILKSDEQPEDVLFEVTFLNWTTKNLTLNFEFKNPKVVSTGVIKDDLYIQYRLPQLFRTEAGESFIKPKYPYIT